MLKLRIENIITYINSCCKSVFDQQNKNSLGRDKSKIFAKRKSINKEKERFFVRMMRVFFFFN